MEKDYWRLDFTNCSIAVCCEHGAYKDGYEVLSAAEEQGVLEDYDLIASECFNSENITDDAYEMKQWSECAEKV